MRCMLRNKRPFAYATYTESSELQDEGGYYTGEWSPAYSEPIQCSGNISAARGTADVDLFGGEIRYDKVITLAKRPSGLDEYSVLWIENDPETKPHDYVVERIAESINGVNIAVRKVNVSNVPEPEPPAPDPEPEPGPNPETDPDTAPDDDNGVNENAAESDGDSGQ